MKRYFLRAFAAILFVSGIFLLRNVFAGSYPDSRVLLATAFMLVVAGLVAARYAVQRNRLDQTIEKHELEDTFE